MGNYRMDYAAHSHHHVYNRGYMKTDLFHTRRDYEQFVSIVEDVIRHYPMVEIVIYCLLPNHFHFLLQQTVD